MEKKIFGDAGNTVVIEERLEGPEISLLAFVDGYNAYLLEGAQDHKRIGDNDTGPNTGGMGVVCPGGLSGGGPEKDEELLKQIESEILVPTLDALRRDGIDYRGVLYAGLMLTPAGPKVLEYNCRFGDPECQALMVRLESDLLDLLLACGSRKLEDADIRWSHESAAASCCIVMAAQGYPGKPVSGAVITGIDQAEKVEGVKVFLAGVKKNEEGKLATAGGRVLNITAVGESPAQARARAYEAAAKIHFKGAQMRTDIGAAAVHANA
jgi:phosphoribosylamine--glycine ligase